MSRAAGREAGFTLIEMLVTLAIMALIAGLAYPALQHQVARSALTSARMAMTLGFAEARAQAIARAEPSRLTLTDDGTALQVSGSGPAIALPPGTALDWPAHGLTFLGDGTNSGAAGTIAVNGDVASLHFAIQPDQARLAFTP